MHVISEHMQMRQAKGRQQRARQLVMEMQILMTVVAQQALLCTPMEVLTNTCLTMRKREAISPHLQCAQCKAPHVRCLDWWSKVEFEGLATFGKVTSTKSIDVLYDARNERI